MVRYAYLTSLSHSGSTLLAFLLNHHPEIATVGETFLVQRIMPYRWEHKDYENCSCGTPFYYDEFWNQVLAGMAVRGFGLGAPDPFGLNQPQPAQDIQSKGVRALRRLAGLPAQPAITDSLRSKMHKKLHALAASVLDVTGKKVFFDSSKPPVYAQLIQNNPDLDAFFIDMYRDARGVLHSWKRHLPEESDEALIKAWINQELKRQEHVAKLPSERVLRVNYEALCSNPHQILNEVFSFLGVATDVDVTQGYKTQAEHHIIGNQMRFDTSEKIILDEKWRTGLSDDFSAVFERMGAGELNRTTGYL